MKIFPTLSTPRLTLRQFQQDDLESVYYGLSDPRVIKYYGVNYDSLIATQEQIDWFKLIEVKEEGIWWAICDRQKPTFFGAVGFNNWNKTHRRIEMGYWLLPQYWNKGIMKEAGEAACNYAFNTMSVHRIEAFVESENQNSKKLLTQLSFSYEGLMKDSEIKDNQFISLEIYAKLNAY
ncbi:ribosomal-protein-alanine N-acetyltransferase [Pedobacter psychrotolerans]|uniref:N-acetyltransferase n=1 Tax=Pedobacter psychrotolerans TaxID=1843235 RepID=A0A4R2HFQ3_9SPHI|nr:GNAT family N-acetyltransferase [Pedobacter psychrotolerans]TCO27250.1 ribosomal-protein-alanine N-acetyltransferase [Pedobacter psychrotolerans]GGE60155.1 N-acetyltransferase [Pedobacter psychrotolerans]